MPQRNAAGQIWPNLPQGTPNEVEQRQGSVGDALWPSLSRSAKAEEAQRLRWDEWKKRQRDLLLKHLREANGRGGR